MNGEGIGLGLNIVKQIVEKCGGNINVESQGVGFGSTFSFTMIMPKADDAMIDWSPEEQIKQNLVTSQESSCEEVGQLSDLTRRTLADFEPREDFIYPYKFGVVDKPPREEQFIETGHQR